ncbi:hypothetical protein [Desulfovibrio sp. ZJ369]|uniref:hypothetical protein n=1 Tax=Desulfovibrio sp. ZJ369 TaxID=2709793 RepID=UPI0013E9A200|nr:hypothetical protein [Desulfovibrio sp. ZJ369]
MTFYESQRWHSGEKRGFRLNVRRVAAAAAFASAEHFQRENALSAEKGDDTLLNEACQKFPDFARHFLQSLKIVRKNQAGTNQ